MELYPSNICDDQYRQPKFTKELGCEMMTDQICITDWGFDHRNRAFHHLAMGRHVYDHNWMELTVQDLEQDHDPDDVMDPVIRRGLLWKTMPTSLWQVDDGHQLGPLPSQPGLDAILSRELWLPGGNDFSADSQQAVYYNDERPKQRLRRSRHEINPLQGTEDSATHSKVPSQDTISRLPQQRFKLRSKSTGAYDEDVSSTTCLALARRRSTSDIFDRTTCSNDLDERTITQTFSESSDLTSNFSESDEEDVCEAQNGDASHLNDSGIDLGILSTELALSDRPKMAERQLGEMIGGLDRNQD